MPRGKSDRVAIPTGEDPQANGVDLETVEREGLDNSSSDGDDNRSGDGTAASGAAPDGNSSSGDSLGNPDPDDRIIRDEHGQPTYSPTGRLRKRRTRASSADGERKTTKGEKVSVKDLQDSIDGNAGVIFGAHLVIAKVGAVPEMELNPDEAMMLSTAITPILVENGIKTPKWVRDVNNIIIACGYVYGPRFKMIDDRLKAEAATKKARAAAAGHQQVAPFTGVEPVFHPSPLVNGKGPIDMQ